MTRKPTTRQVPVLVDNSLNRALAIKYAIYAAFGLSGVITHIPSLAIFAGEAAASFLAGVVCVSGILASVASWHSVQQGVWIRRELYATIVLVVFVGIYDLALIVLTILGIGDRVNLAIIAAALLVMPSWRIRWILKNSHRS